MKITRISLISKQEHTLDLDVTEEQMALLSRPSRPAIQDIFPHLPAPEREFLLSGITPEEWEATFGKEDDDDR